MPYNGHMLKNKLFFVITKGTWGGAQKYVFDLANTLQHEFEISVVYGTSGRLVEKLHEANIKMIHVSSLGRDVNPLLDLKSLLELRKIFKSEKPDIIHLNSSKIGGLGALAGKIAGVRNIIFTAHGWAFNENRNIFSKTIIWLLSWLTAILSNHIIVLSKREKMQAHKMPFVSKKIALIPNSIQPPAYFSKTDARLYLKQFSQHPLQDDTVWIGTISELHKNKGLGFALEAVEQLVSEGKNIQFIIIGEGEERRALEHKIKELRLDRRVILLGNLDSAAKYIKAFDVFTLSSIKEGLPYVILEAGLAEVPIVATQVGGIPEMTSDHAWLVPPTDSKELASALGMTISELETAQEHAVMLKDYIKKEYSVDNMLDSTRKLYQDTV